MASGSFTRKIIEVKISLREGEFEKGKNTKTIKDLPIRVRVEKTGPPDFCTANVDIRGMKYDDMAQLSVLAFKPQAIAKNVLSIYAGDAENGTSLVFQGEIDAASADFNSAPDVNFSMEAKAGIYGMATATGPTAIKGNQQCATFVEMMAGKMGYSFENQGVTAQLSNSIYNGSPVQQMRAAANQVGAELLIDDGTVKLVPSGGSGKTGNAVLLNKDTGLLEYPTITSDGLDLKALYNPDFELGGYVKVESIVPGAQGLWRIAKLTHDLSANDPQGGPWESQMSTVEVRQDASKKPESKDVLLASNGGIVSDLPGMGGIFVPLQEKMLPDLDAHDRFDADMADVRDRICTEAKENPNDEAAKKDCLILCMPDITAAIIERTVTPEDKEGWIYLHNMFLNWFSGAPSDNEKNAAPFMVSWKWATQFFMMQNKYKHFVSPKTYEEPRNVANYIAFDKLGGILAGKGLLESGFDFTDVDIEDRDDLHHAEIRVTPLPFFRVGGDLAALAGFSLYALAGGKSERVMDKTYKITIGKVAVYVRDNFKFHDTDVIYKNHLGWWSCEKLDGAFPDAKNLVGYRNFTALHKKDFRDFRARRGIGKDFRVFSELHMVENFKPVSYIYVQK